MGSKKLLVSTALLLIVCSCSVYGQARVEYCNQPYGTPIVTSSPIVCSSPTMQATPQLVVPTVIKSNVQPYDMYSQDLVPNVPNFGYGGDYPGFFPGMPGPMPPIIVEDGDDDNWHHLLYFLLFIMRNRGCGGFGGGCGGYNGGCNGGCGGGCSGGCGGGYGYGGGCGGGCGGSCGGGCGCGGYYDGYGGGCGCGGCYDAYGGGCGGGCGCGGCGYPYGGYNAGGVSYIPYPFAYPVGGPCYSYPADGYPVPAPVEEPTSCGPSEINLIIRTESGCK